MQEEAKPGVWQLIRVGQTVAIQAESQIYRGVYESQVLDVQADGARISIPEDQGKLVLLPAGTPVLVRVGAEDGTHQFRVFVSERRTGGERCLVLGGCAPERLPAEEASPAEEERRVPVWAVTSGKGGVGKTTTVVNVALALAELGKKVCIIDGDLGTANVDVVLNLAPQYTLTDVINGDKHVLEAVVEGPQGIIVLPGGSGLQELTQLDDGDFEELLEQFRMLEKYTDIMLIDTSSGLSRSVTNFIVASHMGLLVTTPEPPAITDAYALIKVLARSGQRVPMRLLINRAKSAAEARDVSEKIIFAARRFLNYDLIPVGHVCDDDVVGRAVREQVAVLQAYPRSRASQEWREAAGKLLGRESNDVEGNQRIGTRGFLRRFRMLLQSKDKESVPS